MLSVALFVVVGIVDMFCGSLLTVGSVRFIIVTGCISGQF